MSQLKDYSQVSQEQLFEALQEYALTPDVVEFLKEHPAILVALLDFISQSEDKFSGSRVELKVAEKYRERKLQVILLAPTRTPKILEKFNKFRKVWESERAGKLQNSAVLNIKFPDSENDADWDELDELIGAIEAPEDWAAEHDHYLYGTPKLTQ